MNVFEVLIDVGTSDSALTGSKAKARETRTIVVRNETYNRLEKLKVKLIAERGTSDVTFDDTINTLLNGAEG